MRAVIDTNVFVGACIGRGASSKVIEACIRDKLTPVISQALYLEYEDVIARPEVFQRARLDDARRNNLLDIFLSKCAFVDIYFRLRPNLRDESDNHLIELALAGQASVIVTNNVRDFRRPELRFDQIAILTPDEVLKEIRE
jgi:putative PIN family toxin of toxin-antitoxin system